MGDPVRPVSSQPAGTSGSTPSPQPAAQPKTKKIGYVEFRQDQIEKVNDDYKDKNGNKMHSVVVKPGVQIDFPDQDPKRGSKVESIGLRPEWYNPDDSNIHITNLDGATITGIQNKDDYIHLHGDSKNNTIIVDQKESFWVNGNMRKDRVDLGPNTSNNTVLMGEDDTTQVWYYGMGVEFNHQVVKPDVDVVEVQGKGVSEQEAQLKDSLGESDYNHHKFLQNRDK